MSLPRAHDAFFRPYLERISDTFGGITVHSRGNSAKVVLCLLTTRGMRGGNASQMTIEQLAAAGIDASMVVIAPAAIDTREQTMDFVRDNIKRHDAFVLGLLSR